MNIYQHILLATDLSESSLQVALKAQELAKVNQAKLSVVHVVEMAPIVDVGYDAVTTFSAELNQALLSNAERNLAALLDKLKLNPTQQLLEQGDSRDEIIRVANELKVDLIVLGSHGRHGLALLLGSTANAVLHHAHCDVLAVRLFTE